GARQAEPVLSASLQEPEKRPALRADNEVLPEPRCGSGLGKPSRFSPLRSKNQKNGPRCEPVWLERGLGFVLVAACYCS
ncbi:hypothetical protein J7E96_28615, partial [Streptomyces sp. ISL-96]|uniref:hypothetical protein n=1 Tax=Streptomyces sp. ISL-96 TaxID=2819191 RepID=UPI001BE61D3A